MTSTGSAAAIGDPRHTVPVDRRLLLGAGVTGTVGSLLLLTTFVLIGALGLPDTSDPESLLRFPEIQHARAVENVLYLAGIALWAVHHDLLHRLLRAIAPVLSTAARTVGSLGAAVLAAGALLNVATAAMSQTYQQAAPPDRVGVVLAWQAAQGVLDAMLVAGALLLPVGVVLFGLALRSGRSTLLGWGSVAVGTAGIAGAVAAAATPPSAMVAVSILGTLAFHLVAGIRWLWLAHS
ncbi:MAG: hypothetical protein L0I76_32985 [Pseudonocardia sp.]|nr:hypothetical protein [Pseudonocardia sp.]